MKRAIMIEFTVAVTSLYRTLGLLLTSSIPLVIQFKVMACDTQIVVE